MLTVGDLAPVIVAAIAATASLLIIWHAVRQAHRPDPKRRKDHLQPGE